MVWLAFHSRILMPLTLDWVAFLSTRCCFRCSVSLDWFHYFIYFQRLSIWPHRLMHPLMTWRDSVEGALELQRSCNFWTERKSSHSYFVTQGRSRNFGFRSWRQKSSRRPSWIPCLKETWLAAPKYHCLLMLCEIVRSLLGLASIFEE